MQFIIFGLLFIAGFLTTPSTVLFYDQPEYLRIISTHTFWQVFSLGHFPIHPVFLGFLWIITKFIPANFSALLYGAISVFVFYKIAKIIFKKGTFWLPVVIYLLFPVVWLMNTNLMIQSLQLPLYLLSIYFLLKKMDKSFFVAVFLLMGTHIESIVWVPTVFLFPVIFNKELKFDKKVFWKFIKIAAISVGASLLFYGFIYVFIRKEFGGSSEQILAYSSFGILRIFRNIWYSFVYSFGTLTPFVLAFILVKNIKSRAHLIAWIIFFGAISVLGCYWEADLMMRRIVFAGVLMSLALYKYLDKKSVWFLLYLIPIIFANGILYFRDNPDFPLFTMQKRIDELPAGQVLVEAGYYQPFVKYEGTILWLGGTWGVKEVDSYLSSGKRVFIEKNAVTSPYRLVVGNNFHITSLGKVGDSEARFLFKKYAFTPMGDNLELKIPESSAISKVAGDPVVKYDSGFWKKLDRRRIDYGDIGSWIWAFLTNSRDSSGWTYRDVGGVF